MPSITFRIRPSELIIDSTEDGFTRANVESICSTGESSKTNDADTTGEKGFGFKSVFGIAQQIHIQSGYWSFRFEHKRSEDGLGMITPIWTEPSEEPVPSDVGTRFRLKYAEENKHFLPKLIAEFEKLPETTLFALRNLRKLVIVFEGVEGRDYEVSFEKKGTFDLGEISIFTRKWGYSVPPQDAETKIRVFQTSVEDVPVDNSCSNRSPDVVMGFQVDPDSGRPIIPDRGQQVFAFLPIERVPQLTVRYVQRIGCPFTDKIYSS